MAEAISRGRLFPCVRSGLPKNGERAGWLLVLAALILPLLCGCGSGPCALNRPMTLRLSDDQSHLLILDTGNRRVLIADPGLSSAREIPVPGIDPTEFPLWGLAVTGPSEFALANRSRGTLGGTKDDADLIQVSKVLFFDFTGKPTHSIVWEGADRAVQFPL